MSEAHKDFEVKFLHLTFENVDEILQYLEENPSRIDITSQGGNSRAGIVISSKLKKIQPSVYVHNHCISACIEYFLFAAEKITFVNLPRVAVHGNLAMEKHFVENLASKDKEFCNWGGDEYFESMYRLSGRNYQFWETQAYYLNPDPIISYYDKTCPKVDFNFEYEYWYPTSQQLSEGLGLEFEGLLCSDSPECIDGKIAKAHYNDVKIVVGITPYRVVWNKDGQFLVPIKSENRSVSD